MVREITLNRHRAPELSQCIIHASINSFTIQDQTELWTLLQDDVAKLGDGYQMFAKNFYTIMV